MSELFLAWLRARGGSKAGEGQGGAQDHEGLDEVLQDPAVGPAALVVAVLHHVLVSAGFERCCHSDDSPPQITPLLVCDRSSGAFPAVKLHHARLGLTVHVRALCVFDELHIHASSQAASSSSPTSTSPPPPRRVLLTLDPSEYVFSSDLLSLNAFTVNERWTLRLHPLRVRLQTALLCPLLDNNAEVPSLAGLSDVVALQVMGFLSADELLKLDSVSRRMHSLASRDELWRALGARAFGGKWVSSSRHMLHVPSSVNPKMAYLKNAAIVWRDRQASKANEGLYWERLGDRQRPRYLFGNSPRPFLSLLPPGSQPLDPFN